MKYGIEYCVVDLFKNGKRQFLKTPGHNSGWFRRYAVDTDGRGLNCAVDLMKESTRRSFGDSCALHINSPGKYMDMMAEHDKEKRNRWVIMTKPEFKRWVNCRENLYRKSGFNRCKYFHSKLIRAWNVWNDFLVRDACQLIQRSQRLHP